jgi:murein DD-endopeptidase MepM/ murein hydrolase activator NlpD
VRQLNPRGLSWFALGLVLPIVGVGLLLFSEPNESMVPAEPLVAGTPLVPVSDASSQTGQTSRRLELAMLATPGERVRLSLPPLQDSANAGRPLRPEDIERQALLGRGETLTLTVKSGDSLDRMFRRNDLSIADLAAMLDLPTVADYLARISPGDRFEIIRQGPRVLSLSREVSESQRLWIKQDGEGYVAELIDLETEIRTAGAHGVIDATLWDAATDAGLDWPVIKAITDTFEWDIDFALEVRTGDSFTVVYEEIWRDGVKLSNGEIVAAEFVNRGDIYRAARYIDATGNADWFTPDGMNVKRPFLRNPIEFTRVSSNFNPNRRHPILNTIRAHRGVDLAAATGTPVRAAGDGKIIAASANGSYGNRVEIQHGGGITTLYAHLNGYGKFRVGDRVKQGDEIGFVGMTGGATGPHLHYEYRLNGVHRNPRTVELPDAEPIDRNYLDDFRGKSASLWRQLDLYQGTLLARNDE